jgi:precorrin-2 dehydrogenase/sirohydrochlorin ferrochelatase
MSLFPLFLKLTNRRCIVVGGGKIAESKIDSLRAADAAITVITPQASERVSEQAAAGEVTLITRAYKNGDLVGAFLVVAATDDPAINRAVFSEATATGVLCNAVDDPPFCHFYFPSIVRRGDLQIAISTAGNSPALAQQLRQQLNEQLPLDLGDWLTELGNLRREVVAAEPLNESRRLFLHDLAKREVCAYDQCPSRLLAREHASTNPAHAVSSNPLATEKV